MLQYTTSEVHITVVSAVAVFFFNDTATTEIYTLSLHDALPISRICSAGISKPVICGAAQCGSCAAAGAALPQSARAPRTPDRKSTRLNSSHANISYAGFCLKKKL